MTVKNQTIQEADKNTMNDARFNPACDVKVAVSNAIAIGSGVSSSKDYELVIGGLVRDEIRVLMTPEEHAVVKNLLMRATASGN